MYMYHEIQPVLPDIKTIIKVQALWFIPRILEFQCDG